MRSITMTCAIALCVAAAAPATARPAPCQPTGDVMRPCAVPLGPGLGLPAPTLRDRVVRRGRLAGPAPAPAPETSVGHPAGCPARAFCGCGAAVHVFGTARRDLWLASNWLRFPRTSPAPGMAAARSGHVMILESHVSGSTWIVYDANSGGHLTRIHARSIAGYSIVNPRA